MFSVYFVLHKMKNSFSTEVIEYKDFSGRGPGVRSRSNNLNIFVVGPEKSLLTRSNDFLALTRAFLGEKRSMVFLKWCGVALKRTVLVALKRTV